MREDRFGSIRQRNHTHVRDTVAWRVHRDSHALLGKCEEPSFLPPAEQYGEQTLQPAMPPFTHVTLDELSIDIVHIGIVCRAEIFLDRNDGCSRHSTLSLSSGYGSVAPGNRKRLRLSSR